MRRLIEPWMKDLAAFMFCAGAVASFGYAAADEYFTEPSMEALPACVEEDSTACVWNAPSRGNGEGRSFYADAEGDVTYIEQDEWAYETHRGVQIYAAPRVLPTPPSVVEPAAPATEWDTPLPRCESEYGESKCVYEQGDQAWLVLSDEDVTELGADEWGYFTLDGIEPRSGRPEALPQGALSAIPQCSLDLPTDCVWEDEDAGAWKSFYAPADTEYQSDKWVLFDRGLWACTDEAGTMWTLPREECAA